ncbi:MAG: hypothetical protein JO139_05340, partial [Alphaproteobacteria bacterium]|nr:hypothetical protein [Alphaproteobacteria bacterium]
EAFFWNTYASPWLEAAVGLRADSKTTSRHIERDLERETAAKQMAAHLEASIDKGGLVEAAVRALIYIRLPEGKVDERGYAALREISASLPAAKRVGFQRFKEIVRDQYLMLLLDEERAIAELPRLLPEDRRECEQALAMMRRVLGSRGDLSEEGVRRLAHIEAMFAGPPPAKVARERQRELAED